jgi:glycosyltransferase involved in cell wall biosynthesis
MKVGIVPDETSMVSVQSVFQVLEQTLARRHEIVRRPPEYFYVSSSKQNALTKEFVQKCDLIAGKIDNNVLIAREQLDRRPPVIGFLMGTMSRGAAEMANWCRYLRSTDIIVGNCDGDCEITSKFFTNSQIRKLPFSFDESTFCPVDEQRREAIRAELQFKPTDKILLYSGRITLEKNLHTLLRIFSTLQDFVTDLHLVIAGDAHTIPFRTMGVHPLSSVATSMKVMNELRIKKKQVHFIGSRRSTQLRDLYAMADLLVNLTLHHDENFGFAQVEAMACGTPVVGTGWGGLKDTIKHGETGYQISTVVTDSGVKLNWWEAINRLISLLEDESTLARFRENCPAYALEISSQAHYAETLDSIVASCERLSHGPSEPLKLTEFAREFWLECLPTEFSPPAFQRGRKSFEMYKELIAPYTRATENTIANDEPLKPDQLLVLATPVRIEENLIKLDDPIFPLEVVMPEANQKMGKAILVVLRKRPVISIECLQQLIPAPMQSCLESTLKWMLEKGILLRTKLMEAYIEPDMIREQMGQPVFSIQPVDYATDVIVIRQTGGAQSYAEN